MKLLKTSNQRKLSPKEAFEVLKPHLDKGIDLYFTVDPTLALRWAINKNQYAIATAIMKYEERMKLRQQREMVDLFKWLLPIGTFMIMIALAVYIIVNSFGGGVAIPTPPQSSGGGWHI